MEKILKRILFLSLLANYYLIYSQEGFIPPSPQSFSFIKAGSEVSENEHTGSVNVNVPLYNFTSGKLSTGISLLYNGSGVKVDDLPNETGMTWVLDAGGVVTRTVNGLIDEKATMRMNKTEDQIKQTTSSDCAADNEILTACYTPIQIDTERDIFDFRFGNISGSFYLDENFLPVFLKNDADVKIKNILPAGSTNNKQFTGFEITTKEGLIYIFGGGDGYQETTASKAMPDNPPGVYAVSSYFLKEIRHQNNEKIIFNYSNRDLVKKNISEIHYRYLYSCCLGTGVMPNLDPELLIRTQTHYTRNKKRLQQITSNVNGDAINFIYTEKANSDFDPYLSQVEYSSGGNVIKKVVLDYLFENQSLIQRYYLAAVNFYNKNVFDKKYQFGYDNIDQLPKRLDYAQDMFGYYNGKGGGTLIAKYFGTPAPNNAFLSPGILSGFSDRTPELAFATKGALKQVIYPTGGKTSFEYEMPKTKVLRYGNKGLPNDFNDATVVEGLPMDQTIEFVLTTYSGPQSINHLKKAGFRVEDMDTGALISSYQKVYGYDIDSVKVMVPLEKDKRYLVTVITSGLAADLKFKYTFLEAIDWFGPRLKSSTTLENGQPAQYKRFYYRSADLYKLKEEDLRVVDAMITPDVQNVTFEEMHPDELGSMMSFAVTYALFSSNNTSALYNSRRQSRYSVVSCSLGGDNFENGGYEKKFRKDSEDNLARIRPSSAGGAGGGSPSAGHGYFDTTHGMSNFFAFLLNNIYFPAKGNRMSFSGGLENIKYFDNRNGAIFKAKQISYQNRYNILGTQSNLFVSKAFDDVTSAICNNTSVQRIANFYIATYKNYTVDTKPNKEVTTEYIDGVPLNPYLTYAAYQNAPAADSLETSYKKIVTTLNYDYTGMPFHNQLTNQKLLSPDGSVTETRYQYAKEKNNQYLIGKNMIGVPLETEVKKDGKVISKTETLYPDSQTSADAKTSGLALPYSVVSQNLLTGLMDADVRYDRYDSKGNLLQYTTKEGIPVSIVWGYNQTLPIAKVEGIIYSYLQQLSPETADIINASDIDFNAGANNDETSFLSVLQRFRTRLGNDVRFTSLVSTYTYDPLIGVRSITPPSGVREQYLYDSAGRLEKVIDVNGKILKEMKYNYKN